MFIGRLWELFDKKFGNDFFCVFLWFHMFTIITNHYLPEITRINLFIIHDKNTYLYNLYTILKI